MADSADNKVLAGHQRDTNFVNNQGGQCRHSTIRNKSVYGVKLSHQKGSDSSNNKISSCDRQRVEGEGASYPDICSFAQKPVVTSQGFDEIKTPSQDGQRLKISHFIRESGWRRPRPLLRVNVAVVRHAGEVEKL